MRIDDSYMVAPSLLFWNPTKLANNTLLLNGCHVWLKPCQLLNANLVICTRVLVCPMCAHDSPRG